MKLNLITNTNNGVGLEHDYRLLRAALEELGHDVCGVHFQGAAEGRADLNVFLEIVDPRFFPLAPRQWLVPNPEWFYGGWTPLLSRFERVLGKTRDAQRRFVPLVGGRCSWLGWTSRRIPGEPAWTPEPSFLHLCGKSQTKNTSAVLQAWRRHALPWPLTIVSHWLPEPAPPIPGVRVLRQVSDEVLFPLMRSHRFHLCPSEYEGWGHYLHEALGCGAVVLTTDGPPMNEFGTPPELRFPVAARAALRRGVRHRVCVDAVAQAVRVAAALPPDRLEAIGNEARGRFEQDDRAFRARLRQVLA